ncbi:hypothetical protein A1O7_01794 [Cladophialophora yegresii CBS 114405]|uniref:Uncharacterized protein n=1 Tax=Cladophialophora yegresii CBS 114405 TaxID=1182544 RepID=W9WBZ3_9EURO|nr:uncharacterized protein A1O7_01794 [Cladophialophora yegresii CBS 114405]EXJ65453.1 hypothetical protein A1O7_01794 [Cladophialophora yegresii CBS 114405]
MPGSSRENGKLPLTFGVEIEFLFGIRRDLERYREYSWLQVQNLRQDYFFKLDLEITNEADRDSDFSTGLLQARTIIKNHGGELWIDSKTTPYADSFDKFSYWMIVPEEAVLAPKDPAELFQWSNGALTVQRESQIFDEWDWTGLELVSPALRVPDMDQNRPNGLVELTGYLKLMTADQCPTVPYVLMANPRNASVHVHIGLQPEPEGQVDFPADFIRHLAWLCIAFEDTITLLHHPERHSYPETKSRSFANSNRKFLHAVGASHRVHCCHLGKPFSAEDTFMKIFDYENEDEDGDNIFPLLQALSSKKLPFREEPLNMADFNRFLFVNFENLAIAMMTTEHAKKTIEFRQHQGTLSTSDIEQWVIFLTALCRASERFESLTPDSNAAVPLTLMSKLKKKYKDPRKLDRAIIEAKKYTQIWQRDRRSLKQLFDILELPVHRRLYWWQRAKQVRAELDKNWSGKLQSTCDDIDCPNKPVRDCEGWEEGELDEPPWDGADDDAEYELDDIEMEEDESVPMDIDNDVPEPESSIPRLDMLSATSLIEDDVDDVPMEIDDDIPSPA